MESPGPKNHGERQGTYWGQGPFLLAGHAAQGREPSPPAPRQQGEPFRTVSGTCNQTGSGAKLTRCPRSTQPLALPGIATARKQVRDRPSPPPSREGSNKD